MRIATVLLLVAFCIVVMVELSETRGRSRSSRGGSRGGSRSSRTRSSRSGSSSTPKITKYTPIKATSVSSPVIARQTKLGLRSSTFKKVVVGYLVYRFVFSSAPVYRQGYPMYRSYVSIPKDRAVRLSYQEEKLLDDEGGLCLGFSVASRNLVEGIDDNLVELNTTVKYNNGETLTRHGIDNTVLLGDINLQNFEVVTRASYNTPIVTGTSCTQVKNTIKGTMITMYETNPNAVETTKFTTRRMRMPTGTSKTTVTTTYEPSQSDTNGKLGTVITILMLHLLMFVFAYFTSF